MLISYRHRFIFIHVSKAAGTSIQNALRPCLDDDPPALIHRLPGRLGLRLGGLLPHRWRQFREHATAAEIRRGLPRTVFDESFKFAFVRNPWDWLVSMYSYLLQTQSHRHHRLVRSMSFEQYIGFEVDRDRRSQHEFLVDRDGRLLVDFVGRFEHLHEDFAEACGLMGIRAELPHVNGSSHRDYRDFYSDPRTIDLVAEYFRTDIELLGYEFETCPSQPLRASVRLGA